MLLLHIIGNKCHKNLQDAIHDIEEERKNRKNSIMHEEKKYYTIEYYTGPEDSLDTHDWVEMICSFGYPYRFDDVESALAKAKEIAIQGKWGQPIRLRVMQCIQIINRWQLREFSPEEYYQK